MRTGSVLSLIAALSAVAAPMPAFASPPLSSPAVASSRAPVPLSPDDVFGELFVAVQLGQIFVDQKTFSDAVPKKAPDAIVRAYAAAKDKPGFALKAFVLEHFTMPDLEGIETPKALPLIEHIEWLWPKLTRSTKSVVPGDSLLPLPEPYVVPGGRYQELYYWDSYFTLVGLVTAEREDLVRSMLRNFAHAIDQYGMIPNGTRTYQLSRSQPPYFANMVELAAQFDGPPAYTRYLRQLRREHAFWMEGAQTLKAGRAHRRVVKLADGTVLNRYWDDRDTPRPEAYAYDVATAQQAVGRAPAEVYRELRAAAESGWDFSSRWLEDGGTLSTIRTTAFLPVDLNSLLYQLEVTIAHGCGLAGDALCVREFNRHARRRASAIQRILWNKAGYYADYDWVRGRVQSAVTAAAASPLFNGVATPERAKKTAAAIEQLLAPGGLLTTTRASGQQWDAPNGWAPLTWVAIAGLRRYRQDALAREIARRFLERVKALYARENKLVEKYDVQGVLVVGGGGGEYPLQDGFGWTNAITHKLLELYPD